MDQRKERMSQRELKEELEYNIYRKEELKKEVKELEEENDVLRKTNWDNAKVTLAKKTENYYLKKSIDTLKEEIYQLKNTESENVK